MSSPIAALAWEIWRRGRRSAWLVFGCLSLCAFLNLVILDRIHITEAALAQFSPFFGLVMTLSFLFLMGIFNYTEYNTTKEWNGFPYRNFVLPVPTWQLVALPMVLGISSVELVYAGWIKLVWTHQQILMPEWFAVVLGAYVVFYQTTLWSLAGFRTTRVIALSFGGVSSIAVACLPFSASVTPSPWFSEKRLMAIMAGMALLAFAIAWTSVARQRCGGGRRRSRIKMLWDRIVDAAPRRTKDFPSPAAAQFWFEWRRTGWLLPVCTAFVVFVIFGPVSWIFRADPRLAINTLVKILIVPVVLSFVIGKGFIKAEFWSMNLSLPAFLATKPVPAGQFVVSKMKVAALSVVITWLLVLSFIALWLPLWAETTQLKQLLVEFRMFYPHSWQTITVLYLAAFMVLTWRCLVSGLWVGLSGNGTYYAGSACLQIIVPSLVLLACGIWSEAIDRQLQNHPDLAMSVTLRRIGWVLAFAVILKLWCAVFFWNKITPRRSTQYLLLWSGATLGFVMLGILSRPWADIYRQERLYLLAALLLFPFARLGLAPLSLAKNRHR